MCADAACIHFLLRPTRNRLHASVQFGEGKRAAEDIFESLANGKHRAEEDESKLVPNGEYSKETSGQRKRECGRTRR